MYLTHLMYHTNRRLDLGMPQEKDDKIWITYLNIAYLIDWRYTLESGNRLLTDIEWQRNYFGPSPKSDTIFITDSLNPEEMDELVYDSFEHTCNTFLGLERWKFDHLVFSTLPMWQTKMFHDIDIVKFADIRRGRR